MINFAKKIIDQKEEDKDRANKNKNKTTAKGDRTPPAMKAPPSPSRKKPTKSSSALKGLGNNLYANSTATAEDYLTNWDGSGFEVGGGYYKKGGRLKNAGKKRVALRGQRSELRGS